jgi:hypothetical protein
MVFYVQISKSCRHWNCEFCNSNLIDLNTISIISTHNKLTQVTRIHQLSSVHENSCAISNCLFDTLIKVKKGKVVLLRCIEAHLG